MSSARTRKFLVSLSLLVMSASSVLAGAEAGKAAPAASAPPLSPAAAQWWDDIAAIANDGMEGRLTGSAGYMRAAAYVISRFKAEGLRPAGTAGFMQQVMFEQQLIDQNASTL